jgi:hypothetical protein
MIIILLFLLIIYENIISMIRKLKRRNQFKRASKRAQDTNKQLLVIGDPYNGVASIISGSDYTCGDICLDITGCPKCDNGVKARLEDYLPTINLDEYVIYISCVLEYVDDLPLILSYLNKVPSNDLYVVNVEWYTIAAYFYPFFLTKESQAKWIKGPFGNYIKNPFII